ncbi:MAG TPA: DNA translocase FtsK [Candidatus Paceibacterota bacterium]
MKKKKQKHNDTKLSLWREGLRPETRHSVGAIVAFAIGAVILLAYFGKAGVVGNMTHRLFTTLFGTMFLMVPATFFAMGIGLLRASRPRLVATTLAGGIILLLAVLGAVDVLGGSKTSGYVGFLFAYPLLRFFDFWASIILLGALGVVGLVVMLNISLWPRRDSTDETHQEQHVIPSVAPVISTPPAAIERKQDHHTDVEEEDKEETDRADSGEGGFLQRTLRSHRGGTKYTKDYAAPPLSLLDDTKGIPSSGDIKANANIIKRTLANFGIDVEMGEVHVGPSVTQYTLKPAEGIKLSRITALHNDLALALAAHPLRIEAPIPGKSFVGIEVPNRSIALVGLRSLLGDEAYEKSPPLTFAVGRDVAGNPVYADIAKMPHLLIAGSTGSGKSIAIHALILSMFYKNSPQTLRFIMIDPKRVELSIYNEAPHLLTPVIIEAKKAVLALRWAVREMERRYELLSAEHARDIHSYNIAIVKASRADEMLPNLLIVIDELADLMGTYPREIEASIVRLAQMSRAVGIHLVVSTQRPSVEVITGLIKANITARIAMVVASNIDSRTILDMSGAEKLLGNGDMLYLAGDTAKPRRVQGAFIAEREVKSVVGYLKEHVDEEADHMTLEGTAPLSEGLGESVLEQDDYDGDDELYEEAKSIVIEAQKASTSYLQRRLRLGYARAARLMDILQERGVVGPGEGAKPREVLIKKSDGPMNTIHNNDDDSVDTPYTNFDIH